MKRIVMLVANNWEIDSRVIREASAVAAAGYDVHVICDKAEPAYTEVVSEGVTYHCLPAWRPREHLTQLPGMLGYHMRVAALAVIGAAKDHRPCQALLLAAKLTLGLVLAIAMAPFLTVLLGLVLIAGKLIRPLKPTLKKLPFYPALAKVRERIWRDFVHGTLRNARKAIWHHFAIDSAHYLNQFGIRGAPLALSLKPDLVHAHDLVTLSGGYAVARATGSPLIYDAHELETHTNYWGLNPHMRRWVEIYERTLIGKSTAIVTVCESIADWLRDNYHIPRPIVVHNTPNLEKIAPGERTKTTLRSVAGISKDVPLAVYVGSVTIDRGLVECVRALAFAPKLHFAFVGPRYIETEKEILATALEIDVSDRVHLIDAVPSSQVTGFVSDADCSVIAIQNVCLSYYFCFPNKLLESVLADVPVVVARLIELENFVARFHTGLVADETDPAAIAAAVMEVIANKANLRPTAATREAIITEYGWATQRKKLLDLYARIFTPKRAMPTLKEASSGRTALVS